jgi:hypothetical protein
MSLPEGNSAPGFTPVVEDQPQMLTFLANDWFVSHPQVSSDKTGVGLLYPLDDGTCFVKQDHQRYLFDSVCA